MNDQLARKYDYYTTSPQKSTVTKTTTVKRKVTNTQKAKLKRQKLLAKRRRNTLTFVTIFTIFGTLFFALYVFSINGVL